MIYFITEQLIKAKSDIISTIISIAPNFKICPAGSILSSDTDGRANTISDSLLAKKRRLIDNQSFAYGFMSYDNIATENPQ